MVEPAMQAKEMEAPRTAVRKMEVQKTAVQKTAVPKTAVRRMAVRRTEVQRMAARRMEGQRIQKPTCGGGTFLNGGRNRISKGAIRTGNPARRDTAIPPTAFRSSRNMTPTG